MPSIGELFVTLGLKTETSVDNGLRKLQQLGQTASRVTQQMNATARGSASVWADMARAVGTTNSVLGNLGNTSRVVAREISGIGTAMKQVTRDAKDLALSANTAIARQASAARASAEAARLRMFTPGNAAMDTLRNRLGGGNVDEGPGMFGIGQRNRTSWANFMAGAPQPVGPERYFPSFGGPGGGSGGAGGGRPGRRPGGGGGGSSGGYNRFGPLGQASSFRRVILGAGIYQTIQEMAQLSDSYSNIVTRLRQVTSSQTELNNTYERLHGIANTSQADLKTVSESYVRIKQSTDRMGLSAEDTFKVVDRITKAFALSGASTAEANGAMTQLTQAFNSNKLAGDEFRSIAENMPSILKALAVTMKVPEDKLKDLAKEGKITRKVLVDTFLAANHLDKDIEGRAKTFSGHWKVFMNDIMKPIGEAMGDPEVQAAFAEVLKTLAFVIVEIVKVLPPLLKGLASFIKGLREGKPWAIALAAVIGVILLPQVLALVGAFTRLLTLPFTGFLGNMAKLRGLSSAGGLTSALGFGGGAAGAGAGGAAAGAGGTVAAAGGLSVIPLIGQSIAAGLMLREGSKYANSSFGLDKKTDGWYSTLTGGFADVPGLFDSIDINKMMGSGKTGPGVSGGGGAANVNIGSTTVNIYAKDMKDAADQFGEDLINRRNREASAVFNRRNS